MANVFPFKSEKPKPPALDAPGAKKPAVPFGAKHEAAETPQVEAQEEDSKAKLAYIRTLAQEILAAIGEEEESEPEGDMPEEEVAE